MAKYVKGQSGNPFGRPRKQISNLGSEARKWTDLALTTLVEVCKGEVRGATVRDRLTAAAHILDRGYGRPVQSVDLMLLSKRLAELSMDELIELNSRLTGGTEGDAEKSDKETVN